MMLMPTFLPPSIDNRATATVVRRAAALVAVVSSLAGCATSLTPAPIQDRSPTRGTATTSSAVNPAPTTSVTATSSTTIPATTSAPIATTGSFADKAGQPGYYLVKPGDTVMRVALDTGQYWRDIVRWNSMDNPNALEVGKVLRVVPPPGEAQAKPIAMPTKVDAKPLSPASTPVSPASIPAPAVVVTTPAPTPSTTTTAPAVSSDTAEEDVVWSWPAAGSVAMPFDETRNKGIDIAGKLGDPVYAAGEGRVLYADSGLRGYGNLVIIRHNNTYLSAYAHNSKLLVKEGDVVRRNQRIAEMGNSATDRVKLHFEIRRQGKAIDPSKLLPSK